ncbi:MAG TPA: divalent-cation tolerance protein CutA [Nitrospirota bacterium]|nr:divalent-cation tolerance protein CutA [Nitrospirota bacterium]
MADEIIVLITTASRDEATRIGTALVNEHIAACVNILPQIRSLFFWEGKTQDESEALIIVKSRLSLLDRIIARVKELHSYTLPEVIAIPIIGGSPEYLHWLKDSTKG